MEGETPTGKELARDPQRYTWELELLISGAVTFALLQLPGRFNALFARLEPHLGQEIFMGAILVYTYGKLALYTLIGAFLLHLASRAYWVSLIGLDSVFPAGPNWDNSSAGPFFRRVYRDRVKPLRESIRRADDFASVLFSLAFSTVAVFAISMVAVPLFGFLALGVARLLFDGEHVLRTAYGMVVLLLLPGLIGGLVDKRRGDRIDPGSRTGRLLRRVGGWNWISSGMPAVGSVWMTLFTNVPKRVSYAAYVVIFAGLMVFVLGDLFISRGVLQLESLKLPVEAGVLGVPPQYYESMRPPDRVFVRTPSIQADVITAPYLRLFLPYDASSLDEDVAEACPDLPPFGEGLIRMRRRSAPPAEPAHVQQAIGCLARLWRVSLDDVPLEPAYRLHQHPRTDIRGLLAHVPVRALATGEHMIVVEEVDFASDEDPAEDEPPVRHYIPFWR